jgi:histidine ammonia-lyase
MLIEAFPISNEPVVLTGETLTIAEVNRVAIHRALVQIDQKAIDRVSRDRKVVERLAKQDNPIYGVTTGVGANRSVKILTEDIVHFQSRILLSHCIGIGPYLSEEVVRAVMVTRANALAKGGSGVQPEILQMYIDLLNYQIHPLTPSRGSVGMADLGPMAEMGLVFIGQGEVMYKGERMAASQALAMAGLKQVTLGPKDGLILCSHNALTIGHGSLVLQRCSALLDHADLSYALSLEGFRGNIMPIDSRANSSRPHPGQIESTNDLLKYLEGSFLWQQGTQRAVQDPLSYRCAVQVHGACREVFHFVKQGLDIELNSMSDNPLLLPDEEKFISHGNFHIQTIAMRFDFLGIQLASLANQIQNRIQRLMTPEFSQLTKFLTVHEGLSCGFSTLQKAYTVLAAEIRHLANPGSLDALPVANSMEDQATMAPFVIQKTERILDNLEYMIGIEFMVAAQAVDLLGHPQLGKGTEKAYQCIRKVIPKLESDRILKDDIENAREMVASNKVLKAIRDGIGPAPKIVTSDDVQTTMM